MPASRDPRVFSPDDPSLVLETAASETEGSLEADGLPEPGAAPGPSRPKRSPFGWGSLFLSAAAGLFLLAAGAWVAGFVSKALVRDDAIGWLASGLVAVAAVAGAVLVLREIIGFVRLGRLGAVRDATEAALGDSARERDAVAQLAGLYRVRPEMKWPLARLGEHGKDIRDPGDLLRLAERELLVRLDGEARGRILAAAKRVSVVTAISPSALLAVLFVLFENLRMLRALATFYGGRPGNLGGLKLARMVLGHIVATGGIALTDDLLGQFLGQDLLRRLSRRLGEGAFNGVLTARIGTAAIQVCRPMPFIEAPPIRLRDLLADLFRVLGKHGSP